MTLLYVINIYYYYSIYMKLINIFALLLSSLIDFNIIYSKYFSGHLCALSGVDNLAGIIVVFLVRDSQQFFQLLTNVSFFFAFGICVCVYIYIHICIFSCYYMIR